MKNTALLLIDIQKDYFPGGRNPLVGAEAAAENTRAALEFFRKKGLPLFFIKHIAEPGSSFFSPGTEGVEICERLRPLAAERIIEKHAPDSFYRTELQAALKEKEIKTLVVCGMMTHMCVDTTVRSAASLDYDVILLADCCATKDLLWKDEPIPAVLVQKTYLASLDGTFAKVMNSADFL